MKGISPHHFLFLGIIIFCLLYALTFEKNKETTLPCNITIRANLESVYSVLVTGRGVLNLKISDNGNHLYLGQGEQNVAAHVPGLGHDYPLCVEFNSKLGKIETVEILKYE